MEEPLVPFVPDQPPPAVHEVALAEDQVAIEFPPAAMLVGLAENETVGVAGGGGLAVPPNMTKSILATTGGKPFQLLSTAKASVLLPETRFARLTGIE